MLGKTVGVCLVVKCHRTCRNNHIHDLDSFTTTILRVGCLFCRWECGQFVFRGFVASPKEIADRDSKITHFSLAPGMH